MDPSGKAIFAAMCRRSGADGSILSGIGRPALSFDMRRQPCVQPLAAIEAFRHADRCFCVAISFIVIFSSESDMSLRNRVLS
jgi:hypothetical protein